ncbi:MAG: signal peptide peptidase SppA [Bacteroides sp.]|nr:signal peptide peptidase SppA [Bacteroides sp.]MCM1412783.1 signal peptide peptidase SppA [Bacteroides sp.]MCM1470923.1 signal peptide peptidase SppA [Bacteroides sp.]
MKKFLYSFLGTMAGIWLSIFLFGLLVVLIIVGIASSVGSKSQNIEKGTVLRIDLATTIVDRGSEMSLEDMIASQGEMPLALTDLVSAIEQAKSDDRISGILLDCSGGISAGLAQCEEIITAIKDFKKSGKWVWAYADNYSQADYFIASSADSMFINPVGMIDIHGLGGTMFFFKDLLDKVGVEAQVVRVGEYKSAMEPFMLSDISEANREQTMHYLNSLWSTVRDSIASYRKMPSAIVNQWANEFEFSRACSTYVDNRLVDRMIYRRELEEMICAKTKTEEPAVVDLVDYVGVNLPELGKQSGPTVAVLYAQGDITESDETGIASDRMVPVILQLAEDDNIDALVLRVNSGGGSAFASEQIWEALEQFKAVSNKPFYVSMGDMAASGGYYISCGADRIYASPLTLTGSIGIFGVIPNVEPLLKDKLGVNTVTLTTNSGSMPDVFTAMSEQQHQAMQDYVDRGYDLFLSRVASSRKLDKADVAAVAQGRVWSGASASKIGLVDKLGGLRACLKDLAKELKTTYDELNIVEYPEIETQWWQPMFSMGGQQLQSALYMNLDPKSEMMKEIVRRVSTMYPLQTRANYIYIR